jgi:hypothetical protein
MDKVTGRAPLVNPEPDEVLTGMRLANQIYAACNPETRRAVYAGRTFGDFLKACRALGVTDDTDLRSLDFGNTEFGSGYLLADDIDGAVRLREMR